MRLDNFDLNLLVACDALLAERSVTRAAKRLNVTQSAMSAALKRLREAFQDDLLVQSGRSMVPTPNALAIAPRITDAIRDLRVLISAGTAFDPATSQRRFRIAASDYVATVLLVPLLARFETIAPGVAMDISLPTTDTGERLAKGEFDLVLTPREFVADKHPCDLLFTERQVAVGCRNNALLASPLELAAFAAAKHVAVRLDGRDTYAENALKAHGLDLRIDVIAPSFIQVPHFLPDTHRIALMHERLARHMAQLLPLAIAEVPLPIAPMQEMAQYHSARSGDAGLAWLRGQMIHMARGM